MPQLEYFIVSESVSVDQTTNQISLFNVLEEIGTESDYPVTIPKLITVSSWNISDDELGIEYQAKLRFIPPQGEAREFTINFEATRNRHRTIARFHGVQVDTPGVFVIEVELNGHYQASHRITMKAPTT